MKFGIRKPSLKKSFKARTTGAMKRKLKKSVNPFYGKKGMGIIKDPKKALYNKVYNKTSVSAFDLLGGNKSSKVEYKHYNSQVVSDIMPKKKHGLLWWLFIGWWFMMFKISFYLVFIAWWKIPYLLIKKLLSKKKTNNYYSNEEFDIDDNSFS